MSGEFKNVVGYSPSDFFYVSALDSSQGVNIDCANIDLGIVNLNNVDLGNVDLGNVDLGNVNLGSIDLGNLNLGNIDLCNGGNSNLGNVVLGNIDLRDVIIQNIVSGNISGNTTVLDDETLKLYKQVCLNKKLVNTWTDQKINHAGSHQALDDSHASYNATVLNTMNLVVGIGFLTWALTSGWMYR